MKTTNQIEKLINDYKMKTDFTPNVLFINEYYCKEVLKENGWPYSLYQKEQGLLLMGLVMIQTEIIDLKVARVDRLDLLLPPDDPRLKNQNILNVIEEANRFHKVLNNNANHDEITTPQNWRGESPFNKHETELTKENISQEVEKANEAIGNPERFAIIKDDQNYLGIGKETKS